jgi:hypothetical protein
MRKIPALIIILLSALSCQKVEVDCVYTVRVYVQERQGGERIPAEDVKVYAFAADTTLWTVTGIDDARNGIITSRDNPGEKLDNPATAVKIFDTEEGVAKYNGKNRFETPFTQQNMMLVVSHDTQDIFAYGNAQLQYNLDRMEVTLVLELYRTDTEPYTQGLWKVQNVHTEVPVECVYTVNSKQKRVEAVGVNPVALGTARLHVFYLSEEDGSVADWKVSSYEDAVAGILTNSNGAEKRPAGVDTEYVAGGATATITQSKTVLVVYDTAQPMYGYAAANLTNNPETQSDDVTFYPYRPGVKIPAAGDVRWTVVMENTVVSTLLTVSPFHKPDDTVPDANSEPLTSTKGWAFYADSKEWDIMSYEDALAGKITAKEGGEVREADVQGIAAKYGMRIGLEMTQAAGHDKVLVVICDTARPMYAVAVVEPGERNWPETMQQTVIFKPYLPNETIPPTGSNIWEIRNGATVPETGD